jgi:hypothetical protein
METPLTLVLARACCLEESAEQVLRRDVERFHESEKVVSRTSRTPRSIRLTCSGGEAGRVREVLLRPAALKADGADVRSELLDG